MLGAVVVFYTSRGLCFTHLLFRENSTLRWGHQFSFLVHLNYCGTFRLLCNGKEKSEGLRVGEGEEYSLLNPQPSPWSLNPWEEGKETIFIRLDIFIKVTFVRSHTFLARPVVRRRTSHSTQNYKHIFQCKWQVYRWKNMHTHII